MYSSAGLDVFVIDSSHIDFFWIKRFITKFQLGFAVKMLTSLFFLSIEFTIAVLKIGRTQLSVKLMYNVDAFLNNTSEVSNASEVRLYLRMRI